MKSERTRFLPFFFFSFFIASSRKFNLSERNDDRAEVTTHVNPITRGRRRANRPAARHARQLIRSVGTGALNNTISARIIFFIRVVAFFPVVNFPDGGDLHFKRNKNGPEMKSRVRNTRRLLRNGNRIATTRRSLSLCYPFATKRLQYFIR